MQVLDGLSSGRDDELPEAIARATLHGLRNIPLQLERYHPAARQRCPRATGRFRSGRECLWGVAYGIVRTRANGRSSQMEYG